MFNPAQEMSSIAFDKILGGALNAVVNAQNNSSLTTVNFIKSVGFQNDENGNIVKPVYVDFKYPKEVAPYQPGAPAAYYFTVKKKGKNYDENALNGGAYDVGGAEGVVLNFTVDTDGAICAVTVVEGADKLSESSKLTLKENAGGEGAEFELGKREAVKPVPAEYQEMTLQVPLLTIVPIPFIRVASTDIELNVKINSINTSSESSDTNVSAGMTASAKYKSIFVRGNVNINASVSHQKKSSSTEEIKKEYSLNIKIHAVQDDVPVGMSRILDILEEAIVPKASGQAIAA
ncbi:MAG: DUF2589 domain-containing protein [Clostridiales bacterium]|nr:DUF2589 domain-containing protein [Clostridiales bacterium]